METENQDFTFLTNHSHVLICLHKDPMMRMRDVALQVGITERAVQRIIRELEMVGIVERYRDGRRNRYRINANHPLRHPVESHRSVQELLQFVVAE